MKESKVLELIEQSTKNEDVHQVCININYLINHWKKGDLTEKAFNEFKTKNYYNYGEFK